MTKTTLDSARTANLESASARPITAVFTGGTSGIGEYTIRSLASHYGQSSEKLRLYIVGRNREAASSIIADCREACASGEFRFVQAADLSLLREVDAVCDEIKRRESDEGNGDNEGRSGCIDLLIMSHADLHIGGRRETPEGLDKSMSMLYYSRMRFAVNLQQLLSASDCSHVISVFGAGLESIKDWDADDMSFRNSQRYNMAKARTHVVVMTTLFMEKLAVENTGKVGFTHVFPGVVITPAFGNQDLPRWFKAVWFIMEPIAKLTMAVSPEEIGERVVYLASQRYPPRNLSLAKRKVACRLR